MKMTSFATVALAAGLGAVTFAVARQWRSWPSSAAHPNGSSSLVSVPPPPSRRSSVEFPALSPDVPTWREVARLAARSCAQFVPLTATRALRLRRDRLGRAYAIDQGGTYQIFRETVSAATPPDNCVVLVVGFRLRGIKAWPLPHWLFQRVCLLTTPFWSGFPGFRVKLWMVDPTTKAYLGIYDWAGADRARTYVTALTRVLRPLSTPGSVFARLYPDQALEPFLDARAVTTPTPGPASVPGAVVSITGNIRIASR